jgi:hypothetical protein
VLSAPGVFPRPLDSYPPAGATLIDTLWNRAAAEPFNAIATGVFSLAILHTFAASWFTEAARRAQRRHDEAARAAGRPLVPSIAAEALHFMGEVEVVFGLWAVVLLVALGWWVNWETAKAYVNGSVNFTEALFVVVIMALASTRPIVGLAERALRVVARIGRGTPAAWWAAILTVGALLGSFVTEPAAMTICALLLARHVYELEPSPRLKYATLGLLFVNVSIGGTLTHFAAPPVLMVARPWSWDTPFMFDHFGWRAVLAIAVSTAMYGLVFRRELAELGRRRAAREAVDDDGAPPPAWITLVNVLFMVWTVAMSHYPVLFIGGFLFFLGYASTTAPYQGSVELKAPLLVGFFLAGLVIHGGLQGWWIAPVLASLKDEPLFLTAVVLTAFNDNALITYLATLVPNLSGSLKVAVVGGAVTGGGLTLIANAPNPAGRALLGRFFDNAVSPLWLLAGALVPTVVATIAFRLL